MIVVDELHFLVVPELPWACWEFELNRKIIEIGDFATKVCEELLEACATEMHRGLDNFLSFK